MDLFLFLLRVTHHGYVRANIVSLWASSNKTKDDKKGHSVSSFRIVCTENTVIDGVNFKLIAQQLSRPVTEHFSSKRGHTDFVPRILQRQTDRQTERDRDRETERDRDRETEIETETERQKETETQRDRERDIERQRHRQKETETETDRETRTETER